MVDVRRCGKIRPYNPLTRVPTLVLDNGEVLIESHVILDYLDEPRSGRRECFPAAEPARHQALKIAPWRRAWATRPSACSTKRGCTRQVSDIWVGRCRIADADALAVPGSRSRPAGRPTYWFGDRIGHADIAVAAVLRFLGEAHPGLVSMADFPALEPMPRGSRRCRCFRQSRSRSSRRLESPPILGQGPGVSVIWSHAPRVENG